jgi:hypothetical protein
MARSKATVADMRSSIDAALDKLSKRTAGLRIPVDLNELCRTLDVEVEFKWMIPEGVTSVIGNNLRIYLRNNFSNEEKLDNRQRFTWAHEICHVLLYDRTSMPPIPLEDAPKHAQLEMLCQRGAGYLLMPTPSISRMFSLAKPLSSIDDVVALSTAFGASYEVVVRRLQEESECMTTGYALILLRDRQGGPFIEAAAHDVWLKTFLPSPQRGQNFSEWVKPFRDDAFQVGPNRWEKGSVKLQLRELARTLTIAELKNVRGMASQEQKLIVD